MRATHLFLSGDDVVAMRPEVREGLRAVPQLAVAFDDGVPFGFAGVADRKLEMLFIDDAARGRGIGSALLKHEVDRWGADRLDSDAAAVLGGMVRDALDAGTAVVISCHHDIPGPRPDKVLKLEAGSLTSARAE